MIAGITRIIRSEGKVFTRSCLLLQVPALSGSDKLWIEYRKKPRDCGAGSGSAAGASYKPVPTYLPPRGAYESRSVRAGLWQLLKH